MYPGITSFRESITSKAKANGIIEMGLGSIIKVDSIQRDERTVFNSQSQFWSILTLIALGKMHYEIQKADMQGKVKIVNTIYDAIYMEVLEDPSTIKWANEALVKCMNVDFLTNQKVHNDAECDLGYNLADSFTLSKTASVADIEATITKLKEA